MELGTKEFNDSAMEMFGGKPKQQTAVEFLVEKLKSQGLLIGEPDNLVAVRDANKMFEQQIIESGNSCAFKQRLHSDRINKMSIDELEQYNLEPSYTFGEEHYNETFDK
jgi:hypothetical protein